jgi:hypothetical protein
MLRTAITIDRTRFFLAQGRDPSELQNEMKLAVQTGGDFVRFIEVGNRAVTALISPGVPVIFEEEEVGIDERDTGDEGSPFAAPPEAHRTFVDFDFGDLA